MAFAIRKDEALGNLETALADGWLKAAGATQSNFIFLMNRFLREGIKLLIEKLGDNFTEQDLLQAELDQRNKKMAESKKQYQEDIRQVLDRSDRLEKRTAPAIKQADALIKYYNTLPWATTVTATTSFVNTARSAAAERE